MGAKCHFRSALLFGGLLLPAVALLSCQTTDVAKPLNVAGRAEVAEAVDFAAAPRTANPVIFIPGSMGSRLVDRPSGRVVWGDFWGNGANGGDESMRGMALPMKRGAPLWELHDSTVPAGLLNQVNLGLAPGVSLQADFFDGMCRRYREGVNRSICLPQPATAESCVLFSEFDYDWRRSMDESAAALARFIEVRKADLVERHGFPPDTKFDVIACSQGSMVLRYYLRFGGQLLPRDGSSPQLTWAGARHVENVVLLGAANEGITRSLLFLTSGYRPSPVVPHYAGALLATMPSIYQLLPRARHGRLVDPDTGESLDPLDYDVWVSKEWGLADPGQDAVRRLLLPGVTDFGQREAIARDHLRKCLFRARQFQRALDQYASQPPGLRIVACGGSGKKTPAVFLASRHEPTVLRTAPGDGMALLTSALPGVVEPAPSGAGRHSPVRWDGAWVFKCSHWGIAVNPRINRQVMSMLGYDDVAAADLGRQRRLVSWRGSRSR